MLLRRSFNSSTWAILVALANFVPEYAQGQSHAEEVLVPAPYSINLTYPSYDNFSRQLDFEDGGLLYAGLFGTAKPSVRTFTATQMIATPLAYNLTEEDWNDSYGITDVGNATTIRQGPLYSDLANGNAFIADLNGLAEGRPFCKEVRDSPGYAYFVVANTSTWEWDASRDGIKFTIRQMVFTGTSGSCGVEEVGDTLCIYPPFQNYSSQAVWTATRRPGSNATIRDPAPSQHSLVLFDRNTDAYGNPQENGAFAACGAAYRSLLAIPRSMLLVLLVAGGVLV